MPQLFKAVCLVLVCMATSGGQASEAVYGWVTAEKLNVRLEPAGDAPRIDVVRAGQLLRLEERGLGGGGVWARVRYKGRATGWVSGNFLSKGSGSAVVTATRLNVRAEGSTSGAIVDRLDRGSRVSIHESEGNWHRISYRAARTGHVHTSFVTEGAEQMIRDATTPTRARYHVQFIETIQSKQQADWTGAYNATVKVFVGDEEVGRYRGSTLPNFRPGRSRPEWWEYSVIRANCSFEGGLLDRPYTWTRGLRADGVRPCLRLAQIVPTVSIASERLGELTEQGIADAMLEERGSDALRFARHILVHSGYRATWRGSAGCLTIHPEDEAPFFDSIPLGTEGTLSVDRGIEDSGAQRSYCF